MSKGRSLFGFNPDALATFYNAQRAFQDIRDRLQTRTEMMRVLDFGSGAFGCGRALLSSILRPNNAKVFLYDPHVEVRLPTPGLAQVIDDRGLDRLGAVDWINLSYVISHIDTEQEMRSMLERLHGQFPEATITVIDYTLRSRSKVDALDILNRSEAERIERTAMADDDRFLDLHTRMNADSIHKILAEAGIGVTNGINIAPDESHYLAEAEPQRHEHGYFTFGAY